MRINHLLLAIAAATCLAAPLPAQEDGLGTSPRISFESKVVDFGIVARGSPGTRSVRFTNSGDSPLTVTKAMGSCACVKPHWPKEPIAVNKNAALTIWYDTSRVGPIARTVTVTSDAVNEPVLVLKVVGEVRP